MTPAFSIGIMISLILSGTGIYLIHEAASQRYRISHPYLPDLLRVLLGMGLIFLSGFNVMFL